MDESTGKSAPLLPPTGPAVEIPAPSPRRPLIAPSLPEPGRPTLPPVGSPATTSPVTPESTAAPAAAAAPPLQAATATKQPKQRGSAIGKLLPVLLVAGAGAIGYLGYTTLVADDAVDGAPDAAPTAAPDPAPVETSAILAPIGDANAVVADINDNSAEQEALDQLDLNQRGEPPVTEAPRAESVDLTVGAGLQMHAGDLIGDDLVSVLGAPAFKYSSQRGPAAEQTTWVDAVSGNRESFDGTMFVRVVDGVAYSTLDPTAGWVADPAAAPTDVLGNLGEMITFDSVIPEALVTTVSTSVLQDESGSGRYLFVDTELAAAAPDDRAAWLTSWGLDASVAPIAVDGFVDGVPDTAALGMILVTVTTSSDGVVTFLSIDAPGLGETVNYRLLGASTDTLVIPAPDVDAA